MVYIAAVKLVKCSVLRNTFPQTPRVCITFSKFLIFVFPEFYLRKSHQNGGRNSIAPESVAPIFVIVHYIKCSIAERIRLVAIMYFRQ